MGASLSVQTLIQNTTNTINNSLTNIAAASSTANCIVNIGSISFTNSENCALKVANNCSASATASIEAVNQSVSAVFNGLTAEQKETGAQLFTLSTNIQTTSQNVVNNFQTLVSNKCTSSSLINNEITIQNITYGNCVATSPIEITFVNSGQASANCAIDIVNTVLVSAVNQSTAVQLSTNSNIYILIALIAFAGIVGAIIIIDILKNIFIMSPQDKIKLELAKKSNPDIFTRYNNNFMDKNIRDVDLNKVNFNTDNDLKTIFKNYSNIKNK
jgi:hypothetical protein